MKPSVDVLREEKMEIEKKIPNLQTTYDIFIAVYDSPPEWHRPFDRLYS